MAGPKLSRFLAECPSSVWRKATLAGERDAIVEWSPVVGARNSDVRVGITRKGAWAIQVDDNRIELLTSSADRRLTPFLGSILQEVEDAVEDAFSDMGLPRRLAQEFPYDVIALSGLESTSMELRSAALSWAECLESKELLVPALRSIVLEESATHLMRQEAKRLLYRGRSK